jgi:hypothetical protein
LNQIADIERHEKQIQPADYVYSYDCRRSHHLLDGNQGRGDYFAVVARIVGKALAIRGIDCLIRFTNSMVRTRDIHAKVYLILAEASVIT